MSDVDALREEHETIQRAVAQSRRGFAPELTAFARTMMQAMDDYRDARESGVSREDAAGGIDAVLRSVWAKPPTKFGPVCDACEDTGWQEHTCWVQHRCGRERCALNPEREHTYVTACNCAKGDAKAGRGRTQQLDDIDQAMKIRKPKPRGFSRV